MWISDDTYGTGQRGCQYSPDVSPEWSIPQTAPAVPDDMLVGPEDTILQNYAGGGIRIAAPLGVVRTIRVFPVRHGLFYPNGVKSLNAPGEVEIIRLSVNADIPRNATPFDAAAYATHRCFCPVDWGCFSELDVTVRGLVPNAELNWVMFGTLQQSFNSCYPSGGTVEHQAAAMWGMMRDRDPNDPKTLAEWRAAHPGALPSRRTLNPREQADAVRKYLTTRSGSKIRGWKNPSSTSASPTTHPRRTSPNAQRVGEVRFAKCRRGDASGVQGVSQALERALVRHAQAHEVVGLRVPFAVDLWVLGDEKAHRVTRLRNLGSSGQIRPRDHIQLHVLTS